MLEKLGGPLLDRPEVRAVASKHTKSEAKGVSAGVSDEGASALPAVTPAAVLLQWALQQGIAVIPKSSQPSRMRANLQACTAGGFELDSEDMASLGALRPGPDRAAEARLCWARDPLKNLDFE
mmetsp:Transcript_63337/g.142847  ORF Transcript_63337/g.142847 Transcript_63337/m.142847 type:complete len:123 (-) Transcript_63337:89-457(-)